MNDDRFDELMDWSRDELCDLIMRLEYKNKELLEILGMYFLAHGDCELQNCDDKYRQILAKYKAVE